MNQYQRYQSLSTKLTEDQSLLVVSKSRSAQEMKPFIQWGQIDFAENRVSELAEKAEYFQGKGQPLRWHFIGSIQTKQIKKLLKVPGLVAIHSVDSHEHAQSLITEARRIQVSIDLFWQINMTRELQKQGYHWPAGESELYESVVLVAKTAHQTGLQNRGLMCMGPTPTLDQRETQHQIDTENCFHELLQVKKKLLDDQSWSGMFHRGQIQLSMGMSQDYQLALKYGSNYLRIGSLLFET